MAKDKTKDDAKQVPGHPEVPISEDAKKKEGVGSGSDVGPDESAPGHPEVKA